MTRSKSFNAQREALTYYFADAKAELLDGLLDKSYLRNELGLLSNATVSTNS